MGILLIAEYVIQPLVNLGMRFVGVCYYRAVVIREVGLVACLDAAVLVYLVLIVELYLCVGALVLAVLELVASVNGCRCCCQVLCFLDIFGIAQLFPLVTAYREVEEVAVAPTVCISDFNVVHAWLAVHRCLAAAQFCRVAVLSVTFDGTALGENIALVLPFSVHSHEVQV